MICLEFVCDGCGKRERVTEQCRLPRGWESGYVGEACIDVCSAGCAAKVQAERRGPPTRVRCT